jgi:tetratricopeptide (TPR) repeat protein
VYHCNRAACFVKLGQHEAVVDDCTAALELKPQYVKALVRRAAAYEELDKPTDALADAKLILELEPTAASRAAVARLEKKEADKLEREKVEMMGEWAARRGIRHGRVMGGLADTNQAQQRWSELPAAAAAAAASSGAHVDSTCRTAGRQRTSRSGRVASGCLVPLAVMHSRPDRTHTPRPRAPVAAARALARAGKLKDLGNMFLGNFGMSVDNFKATKDEGTGSYNISYEPNP